MDMVEAKRNIMTGATTGAVVVALSSEALRRLEGWLNTQRTDQTTLGQLIPIELRGFAEIVIAIAIILVLILRPAGIMGGRELTLDSFFRSKRRQSAAPLETRPAVVSENQ